MSSFTEMITTITAGFVLVAALAVLVSRNSQTSQVVQSLASGYGNILDVAVSPVTGATTAPVLSYPSSGFATFG
jgi:hypothetical protein